MQLPKRCHLRIVVDPLDSPSLSVNLAFAVFVGLDDEMAAAYAADIRQLSEKARAVVRDLDPGVRSPQQFH